VLVPPVSSSQDGVFTRAQARAAGLTAWVINARLRSGTWTEILPNAFVLTGIPITDQVRIRAAALTTRGVVSHWSAGTVHQLGVGLMSPDSRPHITTPRRLHIHVAGVVEHRMALPASDIVSIGGLPVTTRRRTVVDLLGCAHPSDARTLLFRGIQQAWLTPTTFAADIEARRNSTGNAQRRELLALLGTGAHSVAERALHEILQSMPGVTWRPNASVVADGRRFVVDVLVALPHGPGLVIEVDGRRFHGAEQFEHDRQRQNAMVGAGFVVLRFTWRDVTERPGHVREQIVRHLQRGLRSRS
jgi:hypothetical protein